MIRDIIYNTLGLISIFIAFLPVAALIAGAIVAVIRGKEIIGIVLAISIFVYLGVLMAFIERYLQ